MADDFGNDSGGDNNSDAGSSNSGASTSSSSRAELLRHERTKRHRQRLQRAKQYNEQNRGDLQQQQDQQQQQLHDSLHRRSTSESSSGSAASMSSSLARRGETRGRGAAAQHSNSNTSAVPVATVAPQKQQQQQQHSKVESPRTLPRILSPRSSAKESPPPPPKTTPSSIHITSSAKQQQQQQQQQYSPSSSTGYSMTKQQPSNPLSSSVAYPPSSPVSSSSTAATTHKTTATIGGGGQVLVSVESPLPPLIQRSLGDRSYDKRKNAALEIEQLVKSLTDANNTPMISSIIAVLAKDFCTSMNANYRKGGLIGIAATAIGLMGNNTRSHLEGLLFPVLHCFDDPESRVRYYACESLYNIAKVARGNILRYFNQIFDGLTKLFADVDVDVKNGANLLDRLVKDIVTESETFHVEHFLPLLTTYIRRTNPYIRQLLVGWITVLDSVPDICMIDYLPNFLDGLFNMLSDSNREIRQAADSALSDFVKEVRNAVVIEFGPIVPILVNQSLSKDRLNRLTAITWIEEIVNHQYSGGDELLPHQSEILGAILYCISDSEEQICLVAERTNADLLLLVKTTEADFQLAPLLETLTDKITPKEDVPTTMACLRWINMLLEKRRKDMTEFVPMLLPVLLMALSDASDADAVVLFTLQVLARISLGDGGGPLIDDEQQSQYNVDEMQHDNNNNNNNNNNKMHGGILRGQKDEKHFKLVINAILQLFASDRILLENRGSLVVRKLCVLLDAESVYMLMARVLSSSFELPGGITTNSVESKEKIAVSDKPSGVVEGDAETTTTTKFSIEFVSRMVQTLNLILLTANELHGLRVLLANAFDLNDDSMFDKPVDEYSGPMNIFESLFRCWCHSPVATFSLCLLARAYGVSFALVQKFSELEVTVGFLMQIDKLVQLLESPVFVHLRLQMLDVESQHHAPLLKSCYGLLMLLPQSDAFRSLNDRLTSVCNLRDNLGIPPTISSSNARQGPLTKRQRDLLHHFDKVIDFHRKMRGRDVQQDLMHNNANRRNATVPVGAIKQSNRVTSSAAATKVVPGSVANRGRIIQEV